MKKLLFILSLVLLSSCGSSHKIRERKVFNPAPIAEKAPINTPMKIIEPIPEIRIF